MAIINIVAILLLGPIAFRALQNYEKQRASGEDPVFYAEDIGVENADCWHRP